MRILLVSQLYPGPDDPTSASSSRGWSARSRRAGTSSGARSSRAGAADAAHLGLAGRTIAAARRFRPDVVYAHFLVPTGLVAALAAPRTPLVLTAHGQDVANVDSIRGIGAATRFVVRRAAAVVAVSDWLRRRLEERVSRGARQDGGDRRWRRPRPLPPARPRSATRGRPCLPLRRLAERAEERRPARRCVRGRSARGALTFVGDGPLRPALAGRPGVALAGAVQQHELPALIAAADVVCQPSLVEPFGLATLEAMACGRSVVATTIGGPPEFVTPEAGVLVDPTDTGAIAAAMREAAALPCPNEAARLAASSHDVELQAARVEAVLARAAGLG